MKHVKTLSHRMPALARVETAPLSLKNILGNRALTNDGTQPAGTQNQVGWILWTADSILQK